MQLDTVIEESNFNCSTFCRDESHLTVKQMLDDIPEDAPLKPKFKQIGHAMMNNSVASSCNTLLDINISSTLT